MPKSSDEYMPISKYEAREEVREISQIAFGTAGLVGGALKAVENKIDKIQAKKKEEKEKKEKEAKANPQYSRNPREIAHKLAELNKANGKRLTDGSYVYKGKNFEIKSRGNRNVSLTRKGEDKPAFQIAKGRVKVNDLSKAEVASVHRNHERHIERQDPGDRGA